MGRHSRSDLPGAAPAPPGQGHASPGVEPPSANETTWEHWWEKTGSQPPILDPIAADPVRPPARPPDPRHGPPAGVPGGPPAGVPGGPPAGVPAGPPGGFGPPAGLPPVGGPGRRPAPPGTRPGDPRMPAYPTSPPLTDTGSHPGLGPLGQPNTGPMSSLSSAFPIAPADEAPADGPGGRSLRAVPGQPADDGRSPGRGATPWATQRAPARVPAAGAAAAAARALPAPYPTGPAPYESPPGPGDVNGAGRRGRVDTFAGPLPADAADPGGPGGPAPLPGRRSQVRAVPDPEGEPPGRGGRGAPADLPGPDDDRPPRGRRAGRGGGSLRAVESEPDGRDSTDTGVHYGFEDEPSLVLQWGVFVLQTIFGAAAGLGSWLGFHLLWDRWPFYAAAAVGGAVTLMLVVARMLRRRYGHELDLLTALIVVGIGVVLTVLPAAFALQNR